MTDPSLASAGISRATAHASAAPTQDVTRGWQSELRELAIDCTKMAVGAAIAVVAFKLVAPYLNPFKQDEERAEAQRKMVEGRLGDRLAEIETDPYEIQIAANVVLPEDLDVGFSDIAGLDKVKQRLIEAVILPFSRPELFPKSRILGPPKGVLLYGPPGTGKTMLAKAIACETRATFIQMELSMLQNQWFGESQHLVKALFTLARKLEPSIIFVDEIDSFGRTRRDDDHQVAADMQAEFMSCWDGFASDAYRVMILGTTNRIWSIDPAIQRRMPRKFQVGLPDIVHREAILKLVLAKEHLHERFDYALVAAETEGYSGSDLKELACAAANAPVRDFLVAEAAAGPEGLPSSAVRPLNHTDLLDAKEHVKPPVANLEQYMETMGEELVEELNAASEMANNRDVLDALASHAATRRGGVQ